MKKVLFCEYISKNTQFPQILFWTASERVSKVWLYFFNEANDQKSFHYEDTNTLWCAHQFWNAWSYMLESCFMKENFCIDFSENSCQINRIFMTIQPRFPWMEDQRFQNIFMSWRYQGVKQTSSIPHFFQGAKCDNLRLFCSYKNHDQAVGGWRSWMEGADLRNGRHGFPNVSTCAKHIVSWIQKCSRRMCFGRQAVESFIFAIKILVESWSKRLSQWLTKPYSSKTIMVYD